MRYKRIKTSLAELRECRGRETENDAKEVADEKKSGKAIGEETKR